MSQNHKPSENSSTPQTTDHAPAKTVLKFDTGADGFQLMIYVLILFAVALLAFGIYFILTTFGHRSA